MAAVSLRGAGHAVTVYERSRAGLVGRGGGVTTSQAVLDGLKAARLIDANFPSSPYAEILLSKSTGHGDRYGRCPLRLPLAMHCLHWSGLWENIRKRVPDDVYHNAMTLDRADDTEDGVDLTFAGGIRVRADLVCFADGYASQGRQVMFPETDLSYRDYLVWRGVVNEADIGTDPILEKHPRISLRDGRGSFISYVIHDRDGSLVPGHRLVNWAVYLELPGAELDDFMIDADGHPRTGTIPAGHMRPEQDAALKDMMRRELPTYFADMAAASQDNQIQLIYTARPPAYRKGRMCLLGDAGAMVPPLTGAGLFKGFENATGLGRALSGEGSSDLDAALDAWSDRQMQLADAMLEMGRQMEGAFLYDTVDLATASEAEARSWFDGALRIAPEFSYFHPSLARPATAAE